MSTIKTMNRKNGAAERQAEPKATAHAALTSDDIRCRAYEIYCCRRDAQGEGGDHVSDWLQAEQELVGATPGEPTADRSSERHESQGRPEVTSQTRGERIVHA